MIKSVGSPTVLVIVLVAALCLTSWAQTPEDTFSGAVDSYFEAMEAYHSGKSDEAIRSLRQALKVFEKHQSPKGELMVYLALAEIYGNDGKYDRAMGELQKALELKRRSRDILGEGVVLLRMGELETSRSKFEAARKDLESALDNARAMEDEHLIAIIGTSLAEVMIVNGDLEKAQTLLEKSLPVHRKTNDHYHQARALMRLADIEMIHNQYDRASELLSQAEKMAGSKKFDALRHDIMGRMALILKDQGRLQEAGNELKKCTGFFQKAGQRLESASAKTAMASVMMQEGRFREALDNLQQASGEFRRLQADYEDAGNMVLQGQVLTRTGRLTEATKSIEKGLSFFTEKRAPMGELLARIALARVQIAQGRPVAASFNADRASELALRLKTPQGEADAMFVKGLVHAESGNHEAAITDFGTALKTYRRLKNAFSEADCLLRRAESFIAVGFLQRARDDIEAAEKLPASRDDLFLRGFLLFSKASCAAAIGDDAVALTDFNKAKAVLDKLSNPILDAMLFEWKAGFETSHRRYFAALQAWEKAEKIFTDAESPGGIMRCRAAQAAIAFDRTLVREAQAIARKGLKITWLGGSGARKKDSDAALLDARLSGLRAQVELASGDTAAAEKDATKALQTVVEIKDKTASNELRLLLARIQMARSDYAKALEQLRKCRNKVGWRLGHAQAMSLVAQGKIKEALPIFSKTIADLSARELGEGLRNTPAYILKEREILYEDYADALVTAGRKFKSAEYVESAWNVGEQLKMRRLLHLRAAVGVEHFPGIPQKVLNELRQLQFESVNRVKRLACPTLTQKSGDSGKTGEGAKARSPYAPVEAFLKEVAKKHPHLEALWLSAAPSSSDVATELGARDRYITVLATRTQFHLFLVGKDGIKAADASLAAKSVVKLADAVSKGISSPFYYKIDKRAGDLWTALFGTFAAQIESAEKLIIETDGQLTMFPFEALVPGKFPDSYQEQQTVPLLFEKMQIVRTTSAFRFVHSRRRPMTTPASKLIVFKSPTLPKESSSGSSESALLLSTWKRALAAFDSSPEVGEANAYGENAKVFAGDSATRSKFLQRESARYPLIQLSCPVLLPRTPAGKLLQPFVVFSPEDNNPATAFCGITDLSSTMLPAEGVVLTWIDRTGDNTDEALFLLLESFGLAGTGWIMLPLWQTDRQGQTETISFMTAFYGALKSGNPATAALTKARQTFAPDSNRKNKCNPARMALF